jgi:ProQ/FINO family
MGPHPRKLIVRTFEPKPNTYTAKVKAKAELEPQQPHLNSTSSKRQPRGAESKAKPKVRVPGPGADRKPGLSLAEQRQRKRARLAALAWLKATFPVLFDAYPPRPLMVGVGKLIAPIAREAGVKRHDVGAALHYFTRGQSYLAALAADGAMRFGLDGEPVGPVEPEHRTEALKLLAVIAEIKERHSAPVDREGCQIASPSL